MSRRSAMFAAALVLSAFAARPAVAQVEVTPFVGMALTTRNLVFDTAGGAYVRMSSHAVYGIRFGTAASERLRVELALLGGAGALEHYASEALEFDFTMLAADLRGRFRVAGGESAALALVGGVGYTHYNVGYWQAVEEIVSGAFEGKVTGVVGLGLDAKVDNRLRLSVDVLDRIHAQGLDIPGDPVIEYTQHDLTIAAGLTFPLGK